MGTALKFKSFKLDRDQIEKVKGDGAGKHHLHGVTATVESGEALHRRITATRVVFTGVLPALFWRKKAGGTSFLTVEGPGFAWVEEVGRKERGDALQFAASVRAAAVATPGRSRPARDSFKRRT